MAKMVEIEIPMLGQSGMDVTVRKWFKKVGEEVTKGESLYELSNEKLAQEIESPATGKLAEILQEEGSSVPVGTVIGKLEVE